MNRQVVVTASGDRCGDDTLALSREARVTGAWSRALALEGATSVHPAGTADGVADGVADAPVVAAGLAGAFAGVAGAAVAAPLREESLRLASRSPTSLSPRTSPTAIVITSGTAISMTRLPGGPDGDQRLRRIKPTSMRL